MLTIYTRLNLYIGKLKTGKMGKKLKQIETVITKLCLSPNSYLFQIF